MNKSNTSKSKEFIEKERNVRESLRLSIEQELVGDMIRLLDEKLYCDITFVIDDKDFLAHVAILSARAPAFNQKFLPQLLAPTEVQSCIYIQDIKPEEFLGFLRSVYTDNKVQDYSANEYPWTEKVSWFYPKDDVQPEQHEMYNGLEDSIEESEIVDQNDHNGPNKTRKVEDSKPEKEEIISCTQSENITEISSASLSNGIVKESGSYEEVKEDDCEISVHECQSSGAGARTKETKKTGRLNGEEVNLIEMEACCKIGADLLTLVNDTKTSDVTFVLNDTERIKAHRSILCTRSSYFSAMLYGGWTEGQANEIPIYGIHSSKAFLAVLYYLYGGITRIPLEITDICEVLRLSDMYGLEGLKEVVCCQLKIDKCHLFHKPCSECIAGVIDCLDVSDLFQISDLKSQSLRWISKYFDRVYGTKHFASLNKTLQEETLAIIQSTMNTSNVLDLFSRGEKLSSSIPRIKWAEPVLPLVSSHMSSCLSYIASHFPVIARQQAFLDMLKGVGWSIPLLEKILTAVGKHLTVNNCCEQFKETMSLRDILNADVPVEESFEKQFSEESYKLVDSLQSRCQEFIVSNLHRVSHTEGWKHLGPKTQNEVRKSKGGLFVDIGLPGQAKNPKKSDPTKRPPFSKRPVKNPSSQKASSTGLTSRCRPQGSAGSLDSTRRSFQDRPSASATGLATRDRPPSGRPPSSVTSERTRSSVQDATFNRPSTSATGLASRGRPPSSVTSDRTRRSVQDATSSRASTSATGLASRGRPQSSVSRSEDRTRRSVQDATSNRPSASATGLATRGRPQSSVSRSKDRTRSSIQDATSNRPSASATGLAARGRPQSSVSRSEDRTRSSVQNATSNRASTSATELASRGRPKSSVTSERTRRSVQDATPTRSLPSTSRTVKGTAANNTTLNASVSQNLSRQESNMRNSRSASADVSTSRPMSASTSNMKRPNSSNTAVSSITHAVGLPAHRLSRSCSDFNRAKLVDVSGRKYSSDPSISERERKAGEKRFNESSKPKAPSGKTSGSIVMSENTNASQSRAEANRMKLARENFVGPVRLAQRGKSQPKVSDQKKKNQKVSVDSNQKNSASNNKPKQMETQNDKRPLAAQSIPPSNQSSRIQDQTITISTGSDLNVSSELVTSPAVLSGEDDSMLLNEAVEVSSWPVQEDGSSSALTLSSSVQESKVTSQDDSLRTTEVSASPSSSSSLVQESRGSSECTSLPPSPSSHSSSSSCSTKN